MSNTNMPGVGQNTPVTLAQAQKPRVVVHAHGTTTYSRYLITQSQKAELSRLRWLPAGKTGRNAAQHKKGIHHAEL
jgi:hypothetical protein